MIPRVDGGGTTYDPQRIEPVVAPLKPEANDPVTFEDVVEMTAKVGEALWYGAMQAAHIAKIYQANNPPPITTQGSGIATVADYRVGSPTRPPIGHDNGFLQNPNDPNDPVPIPTVPPTGADLQALSDWRSKTDWAGRIQWLPVGPHTDIEDGLAAYRHFLDGNGADRTFSYDKFVDNDGAGQTTLENATRDIQLGAQEVYRQMVGQDPELRNQPVTFQITGSQIPVGASDQFPYPETENWQKAIGGHQIWMSANVTVTPPENPGDQPQFSMRMTLHAEDRYNFNPGAADIATGTPDAENGRFEQTGLAHQYNHYATLERDVTWTGGSPENGTSNTVDGDEGRGR